MTDIVERLKQFGDKWPYNVAADEIETLRQRVKDQHTLIEEVGEELAAERAISDKLEKALQESRVLIEDWSSYASDYFQEKWGLADDLAKIDAVLAELAAMRKG